MKNPWGGIGWIFAFGIAVFAFAFSPSQHRYYKDCAKVNYGEAIPSSFTVGVNSAIESGGNQPTESKDEQKDFSIRCSDLAAQWAVADYTHKAFWLGLIGIVFIFLTLRYTRDASTAAKVTLNHAQDAADSASKSLAIAMDQHRPWVVLEHELKCIFSATETGGMLGGGSVFISWNHTLTNIGGSIARNVRTHQKIVRYEDSLGLERIFKSYIFDAIEGAEIQIGTILLPREKGISERYGKISATLEDNGPKYALLVCITYLQPNGEIGMDAQSYSIGGRDKIGPKMAELYSNGSMRQAY